MEVLVGPTFGIEVAASSPYARDRPKEEISSSSITTTSSSSSCLFIKEEEEEEVGGGSDPTRSPDLSSESSSSIGSPGDSDVEDFDEEDGVVSSGGLACLGSMEDSLPIKRGLSNHYVGKSKSFANLSEISSVKEVPKVESPFNKKRRLLLANKWSRKSSFYSWQNPNSMPLLALLEDEDDDQVHKPSSPVIKPAKSRLQQSNMRASFKSQSCFSLTDLHLQVEEQHQ